MNPASSRLQSRSRLASASLVLALLAAVQSASAATQYWDPGLTHTGTGSGGAGTWATGNANWTDGSANAALTTTNVAAFAGTAGTVTLSSAVTSGGVLFSTSNYVLGAATGGQLSITTQAPGTDGIIVAPGVTGISVNLSSIKLAGQSAAGTNITLTNTDQIDFTNTTVYLSGNRTTALSNSTAGGTTTFTNFGAGDKPSGGTPVSPTFSVNQGNLVISNLGAAASANGTLSAYNDANVTPRVATFTINGASTGSVTINGNNTLFNAGLAGTATVTLRFNMANGTLNLGHDNALGAKNANNVSTTTVLDLTSGTVAASGGARNIANNVTLSGNGTIGGSNNLTFGGNFTNSGGNRTLTVSNSAATTLSGPVFLANDNTTARTLTIGGAGNLTIGGNIANNSLGNTIASALTKSGAGTLTVSGTNNYTGVTTVNDGTLLVNGTHTGLGAYSVASGGTLGGNGLVDLSAGGSSVTLANGARLQASGADSFAFTFGAGTLDLSGALAAASPSMLFTLAAPGSTVVGATSANIGAGVLNFDDFNFTTGIGFGAGVYTLFDLTSFSGTLGSSLTGTVGGLDATISQLGNDIILTASAVPEPASFAALAGLAGLGLVVSRRRRR